MQILESIFCLTLGAHLLIVLVQPSSKHLTASKVALAGGVVLAVGLLVDGYRWQLIPAYATFACVALLNLKKSPTRLAWRSLGVIAAGLPLVASVFLATQMPVVAWPEPKGPYAVGTFDYSIVDRSRQERFDPQRKRELYLQIWYPAEKPVAKEYPARSLYQNLYHESEQSSALLEFLFGYLEHVNTHSHALAPIAGGERFPVLLFNPGFMVWTDSNTLLMEHLASNGYVVVGIGHPHENTINLAGYPPLSRQVPDDVTLGADKSPEFLSFASGGEIVERSPSPEERHRFFKAVSEILERYSKATDLTNRRKIVREALSDGQLAFLNAAVTAEALNDFLMTRMHMNISTQTWVEDTQFVADNIASMDAPIERFSDSLIVDNFGVFGVSFGGSTAGEFCKTDPRCGAGSNLDGMQWGTHWRSALKVPFLRWSNDGIRGENDFSYLPHNEDFLDYQVRDSLHGDFLDIPYVFPHSGMLGIKGEIDGHRMIEIINGVQLEFFDQHLKGKRMTGDLLNLYPEIIGSDSGQ